MRVQLVILLAVHCISVIHSAVINELPQNDLLDYENKVSILLRLLRADCGVSTNLSALLTDDVDLLKFRYHRMAHQLSDCLKDKAAQTNGRYYLTPACSGSQFHFIYVYLHAVCL